MESVRVQYKALASGDVFTVFDGQHTVTAIKTSDGRACCLADGVLFRVYPTKKVSRPERVDGRYEVATDTTGQSVLVQELPGKTEYKRYVCKTFLVTDTEIISEYRLTRKNPTRGHYGNRKNFSGDVPQGVRVLVEELDIMVSKTQALTHAVKALITPESQSPGVLQDIFPSLALLSGKSGERREDAC